MRREAEYFFGAVRFFTRVPVPAWVGHSQAALDGATRYFPLVGILVGALGALAFLLAAAALPVSLALLLSMAATLLVTGAFHEDGLADTVDGFGGGWTKEQALAIMKDSRIGSYGALAVALMLLTKFNALHELPDAWIAPALVAGHAASRLFSALLIFSLDYAREDDSARAKPLAVGMSGGSLAVAALSGLVPLALLPWQAAAAGLLLAALTTLLAARYFVRRIGGYTGDCLGAAQQFAELALYLGFVVAAWNFS
ncbi:MAG: adenosylcobinamide-GDP ribazoletransferase [Zoogloeaceae bacterium]|jgi:adenosylcobinamide-GDP ribazoletransferase|nr:adenosylcobinamide-GDP ribazoletransferase [Zoogloeaceae bacterium]